MANELNEELAYLELIDYDKLFFSDPDAQLIPCGESSTISKSMTKEHIQSLFQDGTKDLNFIASCECGALIGNFYEGITCKQCQSVVKTNFAEQIKFRAWLEIPEFAPPILHPVFYVVLDRWLGLSGGVSILSTLLNVDEPLPTPLLHSGLGRGYTYFYNNFDDIINYFLTTYPPLKTSATRHRAVGIAEFVLRYRHIAFIRHIPVLNQSLHLLTASGTMMYSDDCIASILTAKIEIGSMIYMFHNGITSAKFIDQRMHKIYTAFVTYTKTIGSIKLNGKEGYIRKMVLGARLHCSARAVIVPITELHHYDELHIPWRVGVTLLQLEIINVLMNRRGLTMPDALARQSAALDKYDPEIDDILRILIRECQEETGYKGLPFVLGRNPTLRLCAIQLLFVTKVTQTDTLGISPLIVTSPNADFDGDCLYCSHIKEMDQVPILFNIHPSIAALGGRVPGISSDICITKQAAINLNCWLNDADALVEIAN